MNIQPIADDRGRQLLEFSDAEHGQRSMKSLAGRVRKWDGWRQLAYVVFGLGFYTERLSVPIHPAKQGDYQGVLYAIMLAAAVFFFSVPVLVACWRPRFASRLSLVGLLPYVALCLAFWSTLWQRDSGHLVYGLLGLGVTLPVAGMTWLAIARPPAAERRRPSIGEVLICALPAVYMLLAGRFLAYLAFRAVIDW